MKNRSRSVQVLSHWFLLGAIIVSGVLGCGSTGGGDESPVPASPTLMPFGVIIAADVPARSGPGEGHDAIGAFNLGDGVEILGSQGQWYQVRSDRFSAEVWLFAKFVRLTDELPVTPTPEATASDPTLPPPPDPTATFRPTGTATVTPSPSPTATYRPTATATLPPPPPPTATFRPTTTLPPPPPPTVTPTGTPTSTPPPTRSPRLAP